MKSAIETDIFLHSVNPHPGCEYTLTSGLSRTGGGRQPLNLGQKPLFGKIFAENCMKTKEIKARDGGGGGDRMGEAVYGAANAYRKTDKRTK